MLREVIGIAVMCMTALAAPSGKTTPAGTTQQTTTTQPILKSAIFVCGDYFYRGGLAMLFPPSDKSLPNIVNATRAKLVHSQSYSDFCDKIDPYMACVKLLVNLKFSPVDDLLKQYIDIENFSDAMGVFCTNSTLVPDQFMCTKLQSESYSCPNGGIYGIMSDVSMAIQNATPTKKYCEGIRSSVRCRVDQQLRPCNFQYAELMESVYMKLVQSICYKL